MNDDTENSLLGFFRTRPKAIGDSFRTNPRQPARQRGRLAWEESGGKSRMVTARLLDISRAGAALSTNDPPPLSTNVRLRLTGEAPTPWIEAAVVGVEPFEQKRKRVRLLFREPCPTVFLKTAVLGPTTNTGHTENRESQDHEELHDGVL